MISKWMMYALLIAYGIIFIVCLLEKRWTVGLYWLGAGFIQVALIVGMK